MRGASVIPVRCSMSANRRVGQQIEIQRIIALLEEGPLAPIAALRDMMRNAGEDDAREPGHRLTLGVRARE